MPRGRMLDKEAISQSRKLSELSNDTARLVYTWLLAHLDSEGRFSADPAIIKGVVFPRIKNMTLSKIEKSLIEIADSELIILYGADGDKYLQFIKFKNFQTHLDREAPSKIPAPNDEENTNSGVNPIKSDLVPLREENIREENISCPQTPKSPNPLHLEIFNYWNNKKIITHKALTDLMIGKINSKLNAGYTEDDIKQAIHCYSEIVKGEEYWFTYKWTLDEFLQRGFEKFKDPDIALNNYLKENKEKEKK